MLLRTRTPLIVVGCCSECSGEAYKDIESPTWNHEGAICKNFYRAVFLPGPFQQVRKREMQMAEQPSQLTDAKLAYAYGTLQSHLRIGAERENAFQRYRMLKYDDDSIEPTQCIVTVHGVDVLVTMQPLDESGIEPADKSAVPEL